MKLYIATDAELTKVICDKSVRGLKDRLNEHSGEPFKVETVSFEPRGAEIAQLLEDYSKFLEGDVDYIQMNNGRRSAKAKPNYDAIAANIASKLSEQG